MLPEKWLGKQREELLSVAAKTELSGGSITNVVRRCALYLMATGKRRWIGKYWKRRYRKKH